MKAFSTVLFSILLFLSYGQAETGNPLFNALGQTPTEKEFKDLAGMKCFVVSRIKVASKTSDISFSLNRETQVLESIELNSDFLKREPSLTNPVLGITSGMVYKEVYQLIKNRNGVSKLSVFNEDARYFSFYYQTNSEAKTLFFNVFFKTDEADNLLVDRILFSLAN